MPKMKNVALMFGCPSMPESRPLSLPAANISNEESCRVCTPKEAKLEKIKNKNMNFMMVFSSLCKLVAKVNVSVAVRK